MTLTRGVVSVLVLTLEDEVRKILGEDSARSNSSLREEFGGGEDTANVSADWRSFKPSEGISESAERGKGTKRDKEERKVR
jgi:hypothetical protein